MADYVQMRTWLSAVLNGFEERDHVDRPQCAMVTINDSDEDDSSG